MDLWWGCPKCNSKVNFSKHLSLCFEENGEAQFLVDKGGGLWIHSIFCDKCGAKWSMSISEIHSEA